MKKKIIAVFLVVILVVSGIVVISLLGQVSENDEENDNIIDNPGNNIEDKENKNGDNGDKTPINENKNNSNKCPADNKGPDKNNTTNETEKSPNQPQYFGKISIEDVGDFWFDPVEIKSVRSDIFKPGFFSIFDILVYLNTEEKIQMEYHFDESMNTYVIDTINGESDWWYYAYYDGGWQESNGFRLDHYPYKDNATIKIHSEDENIINRIHDAFKDEVERLEKNDGKLIIPKVYINGPTTNIELNDVVVTAHNLRNDVFQEGVITALDVIMSLGDQKEITYKLEWYETIASAKPVKNYFVDGINDDIAFGTCGFVYEAGSESLGGRNHIHIPSDSRVINSPEYEEWFWICL